MDEFAYVEDQLLDRRRRYPWLSAPELAALTGEHPGRVRRALAWLAAQGEVVCQVARVDPWSRCVLYAAARPDGRLPAPHRLVRLEHTRLAHALLTCLSPTVRPPAVRVALLGEAAGRSSPQPITPSR